MVAHGAVPPRSPDQHNAWLSQARINPSFRNNLNGGVIMYDQHCSGGRQHVRCERSPPKASRTHAHRIAHTAAAEAAADHVSRALRYGQGLLLDFLFLQIDDVGSAAGEAMVLDCYEGL